jgi:hypothetical protein
MITVHMHTTQLEAMTHAAPAAAAFTLAIEAVHVFDGHSVFVSS